MKSFSPTTVLSKKLDSTTFYPYLVWGLGALFIFYKYILEVSPGVMSQDLMQTFHVSGATLGNLAACYFYTYLFMQIPVGFMLDRWSPRYLTTAAIIICAVGALLFAKTQSLLTAELSRAFIGIGAAFAAVSCFKLSTLWFPPKRFALMAGLMMTAAMLGAVGGEAPLSAAINILGWRQSLIVISVMGLLLALVFWMLVQDREMEDSLWQIKKLTGIKKPSFWPNLFNLFKNKQTWFLSLYSGLAFAPVSVFGGLWGVQFLMVSQHLDRTQASSQVSLIFIGFAIGCPLAGWLSDLLVKRKIVMIWGTCLALLCLFGVLYLQLSPWLSAVLLFSFGFFISSFLLSFSMIREINPLGQAATALGFMNAFNALCGALSDPLTGKFLDLGWHGEMAQGARVFTLSNFHWALSILPLYLLICCGLLFFIKETHCQQQLVA